MDWDIRMIEEMSEETAQNMAEETLIIKDHKVYLIDFGGYFGYSICVFKNGHHIHYANDYQLHHHASAYSDKPEPTKEELRSMYIKHMSNKLCTDDELGQPLKSYDDYKRKLNFIHNLYIMRTDYVSIFGISEDDKKRINKAKETMFFDPVGFCYVADLETVRKHTSLYEQLIQAEKNMKNSAEYWKSAFLYEMFNHEYRINYQADYDTLGTFGKLEWKQDDLNSYFKQLDFNDVQKSAYFEARKEYYSKTKDWI